jgi:Leucine-rich repeat (LRR) protein
MSGWQELYQQLLQIINSFIRFVKARRREEAPIGIAAILFLTGRYFINFFPSELQGFIRSWHGDKIIPGCLYVAGLIFLSYGIYRIWRLAHNPDLPPVTNRTSAVKGPLAFTPADGELFRKLGREEELKKLLGYIEDDQVPLIVLMGASGAGKTSLLRAGMTDILKDKKVKYHYWEAVPSDSGRGLLKAIQESWHSESNNGASGANQHTLFTELQSLDELVNPLPEILESNHIIILDQFEQLRGGANGPVFQLLKKVARKAKPPHRITWIIAFRREFRADWSDFIIPEQERGFFPPELSLRLFTPEQARDVISQLIQAAGLSVEQKVVNNLIEAATVDGEVSSVDIGIGLLVLSEMYERASGKTVTEDAYHFAGGAEGLLTQYINRCLDNFPDEDREKILNAMLALRDAETNQRIAEGKTCDELSEATGAQERRLKTQLERLTKRDMRLLEHLTIPDSEDVRYRLPHERLISSLNRLAGKLLGELEEAKLKFINAFSAWRKDNAPQYLLRGKHLRLVERNKSEISWGKEEEEKLKFLKRSQQRRILRRVLSFALIIILMASGWVANSQYQRYDAKSYLYNNKYPPGLYDWQQQLKVLKLKGHFNAERFPWLRSNTLQELTVTVLRAENSIDGLVDNLTKCSALKKLTLDLRETELSSLEPLSKLTNLNQLFLGLNKTQVSSLGILSKLTDLNQLSLIIISNELSSLEPLSKFTNLNQLLLYLYNNEVSSLEPLSKFTNLNQLSLYLYNSKVSSLEPLSKLTNLNQLFLDLNKTQVSSLEPLSKLTNLKQLSLNLDRTQISSLEPLSKFTNLNQLSLNISGTKVSSLEPLAKLTNLNQLSLNLDRTQVKSLEVLSNLTNLNQLSLNIFGTEVSSLEPLAKLTNLNQLSLDLDRTQVSSLEPLSKLTNLNQLSLDLREFQVGSLDILSKLTNLNQLSLSIYNIQVSSLEILSKLTNLNQLSLNIYNTQPSSLDILSKLTNLNQLSLNIYNTQVTSLEPLLKLNIQTLDLTLTTEQRMLLKAIPKSVTSLSF